jgi:hypothetical protein
MGYIKHDAILVTSWDDKKFPTVHAKALEYLGAVKSANDSFPGINLVSSIVGPCVNGQVSFLVAPDGSKEGWDSSNNAEEAREVFLSWLAHDCPVYCTALVVRFGGDDPDITARVVSGGKPSYARVL